MKSANDGNRLNPLPYTLRVILLMKSANDGNRLNPLPYTLRILLMKSMMETD